MIWKLMKMTSMTDMTLKTPKNENNINNEQNQETMGVKIGSTVGYIYTKAQVFLQRDLCLFVVMYFPLLRFPSLPYCRV